MTAPLGHAFIPGKHDTIHGPAGTWCAVMLGPAERCSQSPAAHNPEPSPRADRAARLRAIAALHKGTPIPDGTAGLTECLICEEPSPCETWTIAADPLWEGEA